MFVLTWTDVIVANLERPAMTDPIDASGPVPTLPMCCLASRDVEIQVQLSSLASEAFVPSLKEMLMWMASAMTVERFVSQIL